MPSNPESNSALLPEQKPSTPAPQLTTAALTSAESLLSALDTEPNETAPPPVARHLPGGKSLGCPAHPCECALVTEGKPPMMPNTNRIPSRESSISRAHSPSKVTLQEIREKSQMSTEQSLLALQKEKDSLLEESKQLRKIWQTVSGGK